MILREQIKNKIFEQLLLRESKKPNFHKLLRGLLLTIGDHKQWSAGSISIDYYNIKDIPNFKEKCQCLYKRGDDFFTDDDADGKEEYYGDHIDFENREAQELTPSKFTLFAGGDWQPMHLITIKMKDGELFIDSCERADGEKMGKKKIKHDELIKKLLEAPF